MSHLDEGMLHAWLDGELDAPERRRVEAHLEECDECRRRQGRVREEAARASSILARLEPGPVHAPEWEELESREAAAGEAEGPGTAARDEPARDYAASVSPGSSRMSRSTRPARSRRPDWYRTTLPWAASLILAFGLGWLTSDMGGGPLEAPGTALPGRDLEAASEAGGEPAAGREGEPGAGPGDDAAATRANAEELRRAAEPPVRSPEAGAEVAGPPPVPAEPAPGEAVARNKAETEEEQARTEEPRQQVAAAEGAAGGAVGQATPAQERVGPVPARSRDALTDARAGQAPVADRSPAFRADADASSPFLAIQPSEAGVWLGRPALRLPDLELLRAEVTSGALLGEPFSPGPVVRLEYADAAGQRIALLQQSRRPVAGSGAEGFAAAAPAAPEGRTLTVTPAGSRSLRWSDDGLLVVLSGGLDADALRALADRLR